ncbi:hypothetical protein E3E12_02345 [Formicincola oecophyllae]|uniref:Uncharacterized protein n=1 Tax=Formicincola oecophyllae TaxID=2558361 RepID=A0A4Y6UA35_9PROT|nr:hypothetical protein [Formicincola oecophyllae]QDH13231.1 hypothetical protein E3E12_02345 [Formicincola oecophyllae]
MRLYCEEAELTPHTHPLDALRPRTIQTIAMASLMLRGWNEPAEGERLHLSTMLHQTIALIKQHGGMKPKALWNVFETGKLFPHVDVETFKALLRSMANPKAPFIEQAPDGLLLPGRAGEKLLEGREAYSVFTTPEEYQVSEAGGQLLGTIPQSNVVATEQLLILAGQRWRLVHVNRERHHITVKRAMGGHPPQFSSAPLGPHTGIIREMLRLYLSLDYPVWLDDKARQFLAEGRKAFDGLGLRHRSVIQHDDEVLIFPWAGERAQRTLMLALLARGLDVVPMGLPLSLPSSQRAALGPVLEDFAQSKLPGPATMVAHIQDKAHDKFDHALPPALLEESAIHDQITPDLLPAMARQLLPSMAPPNVAA